MAEEVHCDRESNATTVYRLSRILLIASNKLELPNTTAALSIVFLHKYFNFKGCIDDQTILCSSISFLSCKVDENCRSLRDVINVMYKLINPDFSSLTNETYHRLKENVIIYEQNVLRVLGFNSTVELPHAYLMNYVR